MQPEKSDVSGLWDMLDAAKAVRDFISDRSYKDYLNDREQGKRDVHEIIT
jgi:uncharacterized protein with HEPN domain